MDGGPIDDVFDVLEGTLDALLRARAEVMDHISTLVLASKMRAVRSAVAMLSALQRAGYAWHPAEDGHEPATWREVMLEVLAEYTMDRDFVAMVQRELDELVALTAAGPRRSLARLGKFERLARRAGVPRAICIKSTRKAGDDVLGGWESCEYVGTLVRLSRYLGTTQEELVGQAVRLLLQAAPADASEVRTLLTLALESPASLADHDARVLALLGTADTDVGRTSSLLLHALARKAVSLSRIEDVLAQAVSVVTPAQLLHELTTPALRARLVAEGAS